jgi:outer membrane protein OmpA-like peptidoglycan-associated protein
MKFLSIASLCLLGAAAIPTISHAACEAPLLALDRMIATGHETGIDRVMEDIQSNMECDGSNIAKARASISNWLVPDPSGSTKVASLTDEQKRRLAKAYGLHADWRVSMRFGDVELAAQDFPKASEAYQDAIRQIDAIDRRGASKAALVEGMPSKTVLGQLALKIDEARHLAASAPNPVLVASVRERDGSIGGFYSPSLDRGPIALHVPVPILFDYDSTAFTEIGQQAVDELVELFKQRQPGEIAIVGHTDRIGSDAYNQDLSERRAKAVAQFLVDQGIQAHILVAGKGKSEPRQISDPSQYTQDQIDQLNRRVEFSWK